MDAVDGGGAHGRQHGVGEIGLQDFRRVDVDPGHIGPAGAEGRQAGGHESHDMGGLFRHGVGGRLARAHDGALSQALARHVGGAGDDEAGGRRVGRRGVGKSVERGFRRRRDHRGHVGPRHRVMVGQQDVPVGQDRPVAVVEFVETVERERLGRAQFHGAKRLARPPRPRQMGVDRVEPQPIGKRAVQGDAHHLEARHRHRARGKRRDAGQKSIAAARVVQQFHDDRPPPLLRIPPRAS